MLTVHSQLKIEPEKDEGWEIAFWLGSAFDYSIPFRKALVEIAGVLPGEPIKLELPPYHPNEDFVEGTLTFGSNQIAIYYEYSLGYLSLISSERDILVEVAERVFPIVKIGQF